MSVTASTYVWEHSKQSGSKLVVMLALADYANPETGECWPSIETLAEKCRMTTRYLRTILTGLQKDGEVQRIRGAGQRTETGATNRYVLCGYQEWIKQVKAIKREGVNNSSSHAGQGVNNSSARGEQEFHQGVNNSSPKPLIEPSKKQKKTSAPRSAGPDDGSATYDEWMQTLATIYDTTPASAKLRNWYNVFNGRAKTGKWQEANITPPATLDEVVAWHQYEVRESIKESGKRTNPYTQGKFVSALNVNDRFLRWRERKAAVEAERQRHAELERRMA